MSDFSGYVGHNLDMVKAAMAAIFPGYVVEAVEDGTNVPGGSKPKRLRVFYNKSTRLVTRVTAG